MDSGDLYRGGAVSRVPSEAGDFNAANMPSGFNQSGAGVGSGLGLGADVREDTAGSVLKGRSRVSHDKRRYRYDMVRGRGEALPFEVTRDAIMSAVDAGEKLHDIHVKMGIANEVEKILYSFDSALWFCHTINGGSTLNPGRSKFTVPGVTKEFDYSEIRDMLGVDMRRFFRAFADDITAVNLRVLRDYDPADPVKEEQWGWLMDVAHSRGLTRYPQLAHDSADACLRLSPAERQALRLSKTITVGATPNAADRLRPVGGVSSADNYDSTVGERY